MELSREALHKGEKRAADKPLEFAKVDVPILGRPDHPVA
jgi:hypothetical protein